MTIRYIYLEIKQNVKYAVKNSSWCPYWCVPCPRRSSYEKPASDKGMVMRLEIETIFVDPSEVSFVLTVFSVPHGNLNYELFNYNDFYMYIRYIAAKKSNYEIFLLQQL